MIELHKPVCLSIPALPGLIASNLKDEMSIPYLTYNGFHLSGEILWTKNYGSPVVGIYKMDNEALLKVKVNHIAKETLTHLIGANTSSSSDENTFLGDGGEIVLQ